MGKISRMGGMESMHNAATGGGGGGLKSLRSTGLDKLENIDVHLHLGPMASSHATDVKDFQLSVV